MKTGKVCTIEGCGKSHFGHGWCNAHYWRWRRHGDPLGGGFSRSSVGEPERFYLEVVLPYDGTDCLFWPYARDRHGYPQMKQGENVVFVHRRICEEANGPAPTPGHEAAHSCHNGHLACVARRHLSWQTHAENVADSNRRRTAKKDLTRYALAGAGGRPSIPSSLAGRAKSGGCYTVVGQGAYGPGHVRAEREQPATNSPRRA